MNYVILNNSKTLNYMDNPASRIEEIMYFMTISELELKMDEWVIGYFEN